MGMTESPFDANRCRICNGLLYINIVDGDENYHYARMWPGLCDDCVPIGASYRVQRRLVRGRRERHLSRYWRRRLRRRRLWRRRRCKCGRSLGERVRMCRHCRRLARRRTWVREKRRQRSCPTVKGGVT